MKNIIRSVALAALFTTGFAHAQVTVSEPWVRATTSQQKATGAFMKIESTTPSHLVGASSPVAKVVEVHEMATENGIMKMRAIPRLALPVGQMTELRPGSYHIMLMDLKAPVSVGQKVPLTLLIENDRKQRQELAVEAEVRPLNAPVSHGMH